MIDVVPFDSLGRFDIDWLSARYHFSFGEYVDPERMRFGPLRVWNDDTFRPQGGFPMHGHRDMEIITYIRKGAVSHVDNQGNKGATRAGQVQVMSAGTGIFHSEYNQEDEDLTLFQIWIEPTQAGFKPSWGTQTFDRSMRNGTLIALASGQDGFKDVLQIHQDATFYAADLKAGEVVSHVVAPGRRAYMVSVHGRISVNDVMMGPRDGVRIEHENRLDIKAHDDVEFVFFDLP